MSDSEKGQRVDLAAAPEWMVKEIAAVSIIPFDEEPEAGSVLTIGGRWFSVVGMATKQEFFDAVSHAGFDVENFAECPCPFFVRISLVAYGLERSQFYARRKR